MSPYSISLVEVLAMTVKLPYELLLGATPSTRMPKGVILTPSDAQCPKNYDSNKIFGDLYSISDLITTS